MREWVINEYSGYQGLVLQDCEEQQPGPGEVRLRVEAFAMNWGDADLMLDMYSFSFPRFPARIGVEAAGIVEQVGEGVTGVEIGQRYCTLPYMYYDRGVSADSVIVDVKYIAKAPEGLSAVESASIWMMYMTAYFPVVELGKADANTNILVTAATSTAGKAALEIGRLCGANMIATTRYENNRQYLGESGANHVYIADGKGPNLAEMISEVTNGKGVDVIYDPIGKDIMSEYSSAFAQDAQIFYYGFLKGELPEVPIIDMFHTNTTLRAYSVFHYVDNPEMCEKGKDFIYEGIASGALVPDIDKVYPMESYKDAWDYVRADRASHGKVVVQTGFNQ